MISCICQLKNSIYITGQDIMSGMNQRNRTIDFAKGICILFVVICHFNFSSIEYKLIKAAFWLEMAVPVFMMITGYTFSLYAKKKSMLSIQDAYDYRTVINRVIKYTIPYAIVFAIEVIFFVGADDALLPLLYRFLNGGGGAGGYYYPVLIQLVFIVPVIYAVVRKNRIRGVVLCAIINLLLEVLKTPYFISDESYRVLAFRYILLISIGCYIAEYGFQVKVRWLLCMITIGALYITAVTQLDWKPVIFNMWSGTSMVVSLYLFPIAYAFYLIRKHLRCKPIELLGRSSYYIFLCQMVFYRSILVKRIYSINTNRISKLVIIVVICVSFGLVLRVISEFIYEQCMHLGDAYSNQKHD